MLLVECNVLEQVKVIKEGKEGNTRLRLRGKFQQCDEQNNNGRIYPRKILEAQVQAIQEKIGDRSLVGALDHPSNDAIHLSQASHLITKLWVEKNGDVMGECEILSTPNGKVVAALINDGVKIGISSRGLGSVSEGEGGKVVNEDFKLITFDLVSDPSTKGAFPELTESIRENSERAQAIVSKHKKDRVLLTLLENKINEATKKQKLSKKQKRIAKKRPPFDQIDAGDLAALRNESLTDQDGDGDVTQKDRLIAIGVLDKNGNKIRRNRRQPSRKEEALGLLAPPTNETPAKKILTPAERRKRAKELKGAVVEGLRKVCWGDRYDEAKSKVSARNVRRKISTLPQTIRRSGSRPNPQTPSDLQVLASRRQPADGSAPKRVQAAAQRDRFMKDAHKAGQGPQPVKLKVKKRKPENASTTIERFADVIRERCWKGYKPVKGKKPYSKGSCTKVSETGDQTNTQHPVLDVFQGKIKKEYDDPNRPRNTSQGQKLVSKPKKSKGKK